MRTEEVDFTGRLPVDAYGPGFFRIDGVLRRGPIVLSRDAVLEWPGAPDDVSLAIETARPGDLLLFGSGADYAPLPAGALERLDRAGVLVETMPTPAACRTYNVLLAEDRPALCALIPV